MTEEHFLSVSKTFRYLTIGNSDDREIDELIFVFHGYGQLVEFFSKKFETLNLDNKLFVFPEGMHRFYLNGTDGRVGASWMTKELREKDIQENNAALNDLFVYFSKKHTWKKFSVLGFSQGGATASRWISNQKIACHKYISWASVFPPDIENSSFEMEMDQKIFVLGDNDPYFTSENRIKITNFYRNFNFELHSFDGAHTIDTAVLKTLFI